MNECVMQQPQNGEFSADRQHRQACDEPAEQSSETDVSSGLSATDLACPSLSIYLFLSSSERALPAVIRKA